MLKVVSHYTYFLLASIFLALVLVSSIHKNEVLLNSNIILLYTLILIPFFDYIFDTFIKGKYPNIFLWKIQDIWKYVLVAVVMFFGFYQGYQFADIGLITFFLVSFLWGFDPKIAFLGALIVFLYLSVYLLIGEYKTAELLSIYAYYLLIIGVVLGISQTLFSKNILTGRK